MSSLSLSGLWQAKRLAVDVGITHLYMYTCFNCLAMQFTIAFRKISVLHVMQNYMKLKTKLISFKIRVIFINLLYKTVSGVVYVCGGETFYVYILYYEKL